MGALRSGMQRRSSCCNLHGVAVDWIKRGPVS